MSLMGSEPQQNLMGSESWNNLLGIYTGLLQDNTGNGLSQEFSPCNPKDLNHREHSRVAAPVETYNVSPHNVKLTGYTSLNRGEQRVQDIHFAETFRSLPNNVNPTSLVEQNQGVLSIQDVASVNKIRILNQNTESIGSYLKNYGNIIPQKVSTLSELMMANKPPHALIVNGKPSRSTSILGNPIILNSRSQVENWKVHASGSSILQKTQGQHFGDHNLHQLSNNRLTLPYMADHNLNLPQRLNGASSSVSTPFQFQPATPNQKEQTMNCQFMQVPHFFANDVSNQEKDNGIFNKEPELIERREKETDITLGKPSAAVLSPAKQKINFDDRNGGIDLNKTPNQKMPKKKKHRPKVVVEGKLKRTPKPETPRNNTPNKNPAGKRKYESKRTRTSTTPLTDPANEIEAHNNSTVKSCRRALNFDLEDGVEKVSQGTGVIIEDTGVGVLTQIKERSKVPLSLNSDCHSSEWHQELSGMCVSAVKEGHIKENSYNFFNSVHHIQPQDPIPLVPTLSPPPSKGHTLNLIARSLNVQGANASQNGENRCSHIHQLMSGDLVQLVIEANTNRTGLEKIRQPNLQTRTQLLEDLKDITEKQVCKRKHSENQQRQPQNMALMGTKLWSNEDSKRGQDNCGGSKLQQNSSESVKRTKIVDIFNRTSSIMSSSITTVEDFTGEMKSRGCKSLHAHSSALDMNDGLSNYDIKRNRDSRNSNSEASKVTCDWFVQSKDLKYNFQQPNISSQVHLCPEQASQMISNPIIQAQSLNSVTAVSNWNLKSATQRGIMAQGNVIENSKSHESVTQQIAGKKSGPFSSIKEVFQKEINHPKRRGRPLKSGTESQQKKILLSVEYITESMKYLSMYDIEKEVIKEKNALVSYRGDGAIVSYEAFDPIKKRRPRPKVDLDLETTRVWNLLMGNEGESTEPMDSDKQKWWEKERKILCNRADSFIARMHLVQGDRRFSKWKGSVVDSVIGVFLTQNVSDHLSSSAFMSLAAKFPLKPITRTESCCQISRGSLTEPQRVLITYPDGTTYDYNMVREPSHNPSSVASSESSDCRAEILKTEGRTDVMNDHARKTGEDMSSSQSHSKSIIFQTSEDIRSSSGSNSEAEDLISGLNFSQNHGPLSFLEQAERIAAFKQCQSLVMESSSPSKRSMLDHQQLQIPFQGQISGLRSSRNAYAYPFSSITSHHERSVPLPTGSLPNTSMVLEKWERDFLVFSGERTISSLASIDLNLTYGTYVGQEHDIPKRNTENDFAAQQNGIPEVQTLTENHGIFDKDFEQKTDFSVVFQSRKDQHFINCRHDGRQETFQQVVKFTTDSIRPAGSISQMPIENLEHSNIALEPAEMSQINFSSSPSSKMSSTILHASKQKADKEKPESFDWDTLRKKVQSKTGTRTINSNPMDSMDYEAIRNADVHEIAEAIKERGMNNMLADRIKNFLNRLVKDHEKVDLEWLRDVEPDKVKDYLLSIRGLGLKSVECVRLLTLHNVAFPVDTNVGRIAVRLGWVPLRPLPESLQLHLLELYPVLESIQKYLWPRLCHLDQETLYELHYQMITFGKVFCTKRDPNCNACPMRGDCRHFASAYASARLALPGIEEQQIVCSAAPTKVEKTFDMIMQSLPFPLAGDNLEAGTEMTRNSEPIIEEPKTPDPPPIHVSEIDIEDAYYEDPDEIPVIKLNIEEFATNLQNFIQENKEMQGGDMSKALVVLSPEFASIPVPKLKHLSRLRTEHQVYELPDSHPLLKGLDKRESDDPSPYLLALWTPGETAHSVQPPQSKCSSQEGNLCDEQTCFSCSTTREADTQTVRCTILIPCRTAMRGSFPLNGTYFQVNEVFADHETSINPIIVPRSLLWNLPRRTVFFGTSVTTIFKGLTTEGIQYCFWKGFVCVRGFDQKSRAPRPLSSRLHEAASKMTNKMGNRSVKV